MIESFRLPFSFDILEVQKDLHRNAEKNWLLHFNTGYYSGNWSGIALKAPGGKSDSLYPVPNAEVLDTDFMSAFPSVQQIIGFFQCEIISARFLRLKKGAIIREHFDNALSFEDGEVRLHIPILTNPQVEFISNKIRIEMEAGECWYINAGLPHSAANNGDEDRIHLVLDCRVNDWLRSFFPEIIHDSESGMKSIKSKTDLDNMIRELKSIGSPVALEMVERLLKK